MFEDRTEPRYSLMEITLVLFGSFLLFRGASVVCSKVAVHYWTLGDDRMRKRFEGLARHFARIGYLHGEQGLELAAPTE
jgi:hypothetical protein